MKAIPLVAALLGAVFIAAYDLLWYVDPGLPAVNRFWLHTTAGGVLTFGVTVAVGVLVAPLVGSRHGARDHRRGGCVDRG